MCTFCGNLVSCQVGETAVSEPDEPDPTPAVQTLAPDLNRNGIPEEFRLVKLDGFSSKVELEVWENGEYLFCIPGTGGNGNQDSCFLYTQGGEDYLLCFSTMVRQNDWGLYYRLTDFSGEFSEDLMADGIDFDLNFGVPHHREFNPEAIAAFVDGLNDLLAGSELLFSTDSDWLKACGQTGTLAFDLDWLDDFPETFTRDPDKSLLENLKDFRASMPPDWKPPAPQANAELPFDQPLQLCFASGAGAWQTNLTLNPDGSFQGNYEDADMDVRYVCQFHGRFGNFAQLTGASWSLALEELVLDTGYPVGQEWDEIPEWADGSIHFISSQPYGFDNGNGPLQPGAQFILYTPEATGHQPGTELYGAYDFWTWSPDRHAFHSAADTLRCYALHNLETGYGFFDLHAWGIA